MRHICASLTGLICTTAILAGGCVQEGGPGSYLDGMSKDGTGGRKVTGAGSQVASSIVTTQLGAISGLVVRGNGSPLPDALVSVGTSSSVSGADGSYSLPVPAGTYDVTATAFGFNSRTVTGVTVGDDETVRVNFRLPASPKVKVQGTVRDAGAAGWPLYAELVFSPIGAPAVRVFTDPTTGFYTVKLPSGTDYTVTAHSIVPGYNDETRRVAAGPGDTIQDYALEVNTGSCKAPGYTLSIAPGATESFEASFPPEGWTVENTSIGCAAVSEWTNTDPGGRGNLTGGTGGFAIADSDACGPEGFLMTAMTSPPMDLSSLGDEDGLQIRFNQDLFVFTPTGTLAVVEVWDGLEWQVISTQQSDSRGTAMTVGTKLANGVPDARVRFRYEGAFEWWWELDDIQFNTTSCDFQGGGLVFGTVTDRNTGLGINGATVAASGRPPVVTFATANDPRLKDGLYFSSLAAAGQIAASANGYATRTVNVTPIIGGVTRRDIGLGAGLIRAAPTALALRVPYLGTASTTLTLVNDGTAPGGIDFSEIAGPSVAIALGPVAPPSRRAGAMSLVDRDARAVRPHETPLARPLAAGDVVRRIPTGLSLPWGIGFDASTLSAWVGDPAIGGGDDNLHRFLNDGTPTADLIDVSGAVWSADLAYDVRNNKLWQVNVGGDNCIFEIDAAARSVTGVRICPAFGTSERGLAYDPVTDTFYAGTWNDARIVQFDRSGTILRAVQTQLSISGLAYNASTGHLFVAVNDVADVPDIFVLDAANDLEQIGQFEILDGGDPVFGDFSGAGLELDCAGNLWAVNQLTQEIAVAQSNETPACRADVPWIETSPGRVTVPEGGSVTVTVTVNASTLTPGLREAQLLLLSDTPYPVAPVPFSVTVAFNDVPEGSVGDPEIHALAGAGVTFGCGSGNFCPAEGLTRAVYPVWAMRSAFGAEYNPPLPTGILFDDLSPEEFGADFVEDAFTRGLVDGCGVRLYCPADTTTRRELAIFTLRMMFGPDYVPPPATGQFGDVAAEDAPFIEDAVARGIIDPCAPAAFCPAGPVDRVNAAIVLVRAFGFTTFP